MMDGKHKKIRVHTLRARMANAYLIENDNGLVLFDCGAPGSENIILNRIKRIGRDDLKLIYISHAHVDHYGSAAAVRRITGAKIAIHKDDSKDMALGNTILGRAKGRGWFIYSLLPLFENYLGMVPTPADILLDDGSTLHEFGIDAEVLHTPGHTPGSSSLLFRNGYAFVGDLISNSGQPRAQRFFAQDWDQIPASIQRLYAKKPKRIFTGHGRRPVDDQRTLKNLPEY